MTASLKRVIECWALVGGVLLVCVVLINAVGIGIAAFCFLPYCQLVGANVSADIFTSRVSPKGQRLLELLANSVAILFALLLLWRMSVGLLDYIEYEEITGVLSIPIWYAFIPALFSLLLLVCSSIICIRETWNKI